MEKQQIIGRTNQILAEAGLKENEDYMWSLQGPTVIPIGSSETFKTLTSDTIDRINKIGAQFLVDPGV